jgi:DNA-binding transcriptional LysR family regulator
MKLMFLATLDAILRRGSFAAAADEIGLTPSAVSLQVKRLEEHLGQPLFVRSARVAQPTPLARELAQTMRDSLAAMEALRLKTSPVVSGRVVVGTIRTVQSSTLPPALHEVRRKYPELVVRAVQGDSDGLLQQLKAGVIDAAVVIRPSAGGSRRLHWHPLAHERFVLIAPPDSKGSSLQELLRVYDWIQFDTALVSGRMAANYLHRTAPRTRGAIEIDSIDTIVALVSDGLGVSIVPKPRHPISAVHPVREIPLNQHAHSREIVFVSRALDDDNRRVTALREAFAFVYAGSEQRSAPRPGRDDRVGGSRRAKPGRNQEKAT